VVGAVPFVVSNVSTHSTTVNGVVTSFSCRDNIALGCGAVVAVCGLVALVLAVKNKAGSMRIGLAAGVLVLGGVHIGRGLGVFADKPNVEAARDIPDLQEPRVPKDDKPKQCATGAACYAEASELKDKKHDAAGALVVYSRGCELKDGKSCYEAGIIYGEGTGGVKVDPLKAATAWDQGCAFEDFDSCMNLGVSLLQGNGVKKDEAKGLVLLQRACAGGVMQSCSNVGIVYRDGVGVSAQDDEARGYFKQACDKDYADACAYLGALYVTSKDKTEHKDGPPLFEKSCKLGSPTGCADLAISYDTGGSGLKRDYAKAKELYEKACDADFGKACTNLGFMYEHGNGTKKDKAKAKELYEKACKLDNKMGCDNAKTLK